MVAFTQPPVEGGNNYLGYSRGSDPNRSFEALFSGAAEIGGLGIKAADSGIQQNIRKDVTAAYDSANDAFGVDSAATVGASKTGTDTPNPKELDDAKSYLTTMTDAYNQGNLKESHYWGRLTQKVKDLRLKYPGYREQIDNIVSDVTGSNPANALRTTLLSEIEAENRTTKEGLNAQNSFVNQNLEFVDPSMLQKWQASPGDPTLFNQIRSDVAGKQSQKQKVASQDADIALKLHQNQADQIDAGSTLAERTGDLINQTFNTVSNAGGGVSAITDYAQKALMNDNVIDAKEATQIRLMMGNLKEQLYTKFDQMANTKIADSGQSLSGLLGGDVTKQRKMIDDRIATIETAMVDGNTGFLNIAANAVKSSTDNMAQKIINTDESFAVLAALNKLGLGNTAGEIFMNLGGMDKATSLLGIVNAGKVATGQFGSVSDALKDAKTKVGKDPKPFQNIVQGAVNMVIQSPDATADQLKDAVNGLFGSGNNDMLSMFSDKDKMTLFSRMTSPQMTSRILELGKQDPAMLHNYSQWAQSNFNSLFGSKGEQIQQYFDVIHKEGGVGQVVFNKDTFQFEPDLHFDMRDVPEGSDPAVYKQQFDARENAIQTGLTKLNQYVQIIKPIVEADGQDPEAAVGNMMKSVGIEFEDEHGGNSEGPHSQLSRPSDDLSGIQLASYQEDDNSSAPAGPIVEGEGRGAGGTRSWRNNNPGNIEYGRFTQGHGAVGSDGRFAIFPTYEDGRKAQADLLFNSAGYKNLTLRQAVSKYAPAFENNVSAYLNSLGADPDTKMADFTSDQQEKLLDDFQRHEGYRPGRSKAAGTKDNVQVASN